MKILENKNEVQYLINMLYSVLNKLPAPPPPDNVNFQELYNLAKAHDVLNTSFYALEQIDCDMDTELRKSWEFKRNQCYHRSMIQRAEYETICRAFEENEIEFLPLKGFEISSLYPGIDYRFMSDLDFLLKDSAKRKKAGAVVNNLGYTTKKVDYMYDDEYIKAPFMHIELHHELFRIDSQYYEYFIDIFDRCIKTGKFQYKMTPEDSFIYILAHMAKHFFEGGTGIRSVMDIYLMNLKLLPQLNMDYFIGELKKLELEQFYREISTLSDKWFKRAEFTPDTELEYYIITSGTFGTVENKILNRHKSLGEKHYYSKRIFPSRAYMQDIYHVLRRKPYLLPFFYVYRIICLINPEKRKKVLYEIKVLREENH